MLGAKFCSGWGNRGHKLLTLNLPVLLCAQTLPFELPRCAVFAAVISAGLWPVGGVVELAALLTSEHRPLYNLEARASGSRLNKLN